MNPITTKAESQYDCEDTTALNLLIYHPYTSADFTSIQARKVFYQSFSDSIGIRIRFLHKTNRNMAPSTQTQPIKPTRNGRSRSRSQTPLKRSVSMKHKQQSVATALLGNKASDKQISPLTRLSEKIALDLRVRATLVKSRPVNL